MANVKFRIERSVPYPVGKVSIQRHLEQAFTQVRREVSPLLHRLDYALEANYAIRGGGDVKET
jgi:hypothetical protein